MNERLEEFAVAGLNEAHGLAHGGGQRHGGDPLGRLPILPKVVHL